jgi:hypothetical protein
MGAGMVMKVVDAKGNDKFVRLSGAEKAMVYRMLANFGVYEQEVPDDELAPEEKMPVFTASHPEARGSQDLEELTATYQSGMCQEGRSINTSSMHCCEAAEIVFEDVT